MSKNSLILYVVSSRRDYPDNDESYFGADSVHASHEDAVQSILNDMNETLEEPDFSGSETVKVDKDSFCITDGSKRYTWQVDVINVDAGTIDKVLSEIKKLGLRDV